MRPMDFAAQLNVSLANGWGIVRTVADLCLKMPEGKYVLVKDPNKVCVPSLSHFCRGSVATVAHPYMTGVDFDGVLALRCHMTQWLGMLCS
jgi:hypothetical protein